MAMRASALAEARPLPARPGTTAILSAVCVVDGAQPNFLRHLSELHAAMASGGTPIELVVVANGAPGHTVDRLQELVDRLDHVQVYVMKARVDYATALLAGIENSIGDWVATLDVEVDEPGIVRRLHEAAIRDQTDVALSCGPSPPRGPVDAVLSALFHRTFRTLHGYTLSDAAPTARLLSRAAVNSLLHHDHPLVALETLAATGGYRKSLVPGERRAGHRPPLGERVQVRWRALIGINAVPLRLANLLCGIGALLAFLYSIYVVVIYLIKADVAPGWTTVSLLLSGMFLMLSLVLWLMSEYMLMLLDAGARKPRYEIAHEFGGQRRSYRNLLNVESEL